MRGHVPALDGLRGTAILLVILTHVRVMPTDKRLDQFFDFWRGLGWMGVDLFFVLSGFLITGLLLDARGGPRTSGAFTSGERFAFSRSIT
jgi:peptidoglycan/LPS O-acetylase OafA/YrhL